MGSDGRRSLRSVGDRRHVTRVARHATASPIPSHVKPTAMYILGGNPMDWKDIVLKGQFSNNYFKAIFITVDHSI